MKARNLTEYIKRKHAEHGHGSLTQCRLAEMTGYIVKNMSSILSRSSDRVEHHLTAVAILAKYDLLGELETFNDEVEIKKFGNDRGGE